MELGGAAKLDYVCCSLRGNSRPRVMHYEGDALLRGFTFVAAIRSAPAASSAVPAASASAPGPSSAATLRTPAVA